MNSLIGSDKKATTLFCFSPPVMLATFFIEIGLAVYTLLRYKLSPVTRLVMAVLVCLAIFQLAEYNVCEGAWGVDSLQWARIGYVAITLLPPLAIHLATRLAGRKHLGLVAISYATGALFAIFFLFVGQGMQSQECLGNYVIFNIAPWAILPYTIYYYGWLAVGTIYSWRMGSAMKSKHARLALQALAVGFLAFVIPTTAATIIQPSAGAGIPSIMCGFAVLLALVLAVVVLPEHTRAKLVAKK